MSMFYAQIKHKLVEAKSPKYLAMLEADDFLSSCALAALALIKDTGFKIIGLADLRSKRYFLVSKLGRDGDLLEIPISAEFLEIYSQAHDADIPKHRMKKALKREDLNKFTLELVKFADMQFAELEVSYP
jgi:hypothetical protein